MTFLLALLAATAITISIRADEPTIAPLPEGVKYPVAESSDALVDAKKLTLKPAERAEVASGLALFVRNRLDYTKQADVELASRMLRIALTLQPEDKNAYVADARLKQGQQPGKVEAAAATDRKAMAKRLLATAMLAKVGSGEHDRTLAGYLLSVAVSLDPANDDAVFELGRIQDGGVKLTWAALTKSTTGDEQPKSSQTDPTGKGLPSPVVFGGAGRDVLAAAPLPDNRFAVTGGADGVIRLWDITKGIELKTFGKHDKMVYTIVVSRDGNYAASAGKEFKVRLWHVPTGKQVHDFDCPSECTSLSFSPDGRYLAAGGFHLFTMVWDLQTNKLAPYGRKDKIGGYAIGFSPDGQYLATGGADDFIVLWDVKRWTEAKRLQGGAPKCYGLSFSPDSSKLLTGQANGLVRLWDVPDGRSIHSFEGHNPVANRTAFTPSGKYAISCGEDSTAAIWDIESLKEVERLKGHTDQVKSVAFLYGGRMALTAAADGTGRTWLLKSAAPKPVYLADLIPARVDTLRDEKWGFGTRGLVGLQTGDRIKVNGVESPNGLGTHPKDRGTATVAYRIEQKYERIVGEVAINDTSDAHGSATALIFEIRGDGKSIWKSKPVQKLKAKESFDVDVKNVDQLELVVNCPGPHGGAHAVWLEPRLLSTGAEDLTPITPAAGPKKNQSTVKGLGIKMTPDGQQLGYATDIILTLEGVGTSPGALTSFVRDPGQSMKTAMDEAVRYVKTRQPQWPASQFRFSFQDKYSPQDGGSAGAAFALLMLSVLNEFEIDPDVAVTGDIAVNGRVLQVGGGAAKIRGALTDKCKYIAVPTDNVEALSDMMLLYGSDKPWEGQVFSIATMDDLISIARVDRDKKLAEAIALFAEIQKQLEGKSRSWLSKAEVSDKLKKVVALAPNHESAKYLLLIAAGKQPDRLTRTVSLVEAVSASRPLHLYLWERQAPQRATFPKTAAAAVEQRLRKLSKIAHSDIQPVVTALIEFGDAVDEATAVTRWNTSDPRVNKYDDKRIAVSEALRKISADRALLEKLTREGG